MAKAKAKKMSAATKAKLKKGLKKYWAKKREEKALKQKQEAEAMTPSDRTLAKNLNHGAAYKSNLQEFANAVMKEQTNEPSVMGAGVGASPIPGNIQLTAYPEAQRQYKYNQSVALRFDTLNELLDQHVKWVEDIIAMHRAKVIQRLGL